MYTLWSFLKKLFRRLRRHKKTYRETILEQKPVAYYPLDEDEDDLIQKR